ncbi:hypothetical protein GQ457_04G028210 [Hibiscus cannabinus]
MLFNLVIKCVLLIPNGTITEHRARPYSILTSSEHVSFSSTQASSTIRGGQALITSRMAIGEGIRIRGDVEVIVAFALRRDALQVLEDIGQTGGERVALGIATRVAENSYDACIRNTSYITAEQKQAEHGNCGHLLKITHLKLNLSSCS